MKEMKEGRNFDESIEAVTRQNIHEFY